MAPRKSRQSRSKESTGKESTGKESTGKQPKGMRIRLKGLRTTQELRAMLHEAVDKIEALGVKYVRGSNLYLTPCDENAEPFVRLADRQKIRDITIAEPYRSAADEHGL